MSMLNPKMWFRRVKPKQPQAHNGKVTVECMGCKRSKEMLMSDTPTDGMPMCEYDGMPMFTKSNQGWLNESNTNQRQGYSSA